MDKIGFMIMKSINGIINGKQIHGKISIEDGTQMKDGKIIQKCGRIQAAVQPRQMKR